MTLSAAMTGSSQAICTPRIANSSNPADALYRAVLKTGNNDDVVVLTLRLDEHCRTQAAMRIARGRPRAGGLLTQMTPRAAHGARHSFVAALA